MTSSGLVDWARWVADEHATLLFVRDRSRILLIEKKRGLGAGKVTAPGGKLEAGESPIAAARRELEEEVGVRAPSAQLRGRLSFQFADGYALRVHVAMADRYSGVPRETDEAVPFWVAQDAIPYRRMWADDRLWLPLLLDGKLIEGRFEFDGDRMLSAEVWANGEHAAG